MRGENMSTEFDAVQAVSHFRVTFGAFLLDVYNPGDTMETLFQNEEEQ